MCKFLMLRKVYFLYVEKAFVKHVSCGNEHEMSLKLLDSPEGYHNLEYTDTDLIP